MSWKSCSGLVDVHLNSRCPSTRVEKFIFSGNCLASRRKGGQLSLFHLKCMAMQNANSKSEDKK